jgi:hypothetical protein
MSWCDAWEEHAARSGISSAAPYFWDSARGWIDAHLYVAPPRSELATPRAAAAAHTRQR